MPRNRYNPTFSERNQQSLEARGLVSPRESPDRYIWGHTTTTRISTSRSSGIWGSDPILREVVHRGVFETHGTNPLMQFVETTYERDQWFRVHDEITASMEEPMPADPTIGMTRDEKRVYQRIQEGLKEDKIDFWVSHGSVDIQVSAMTTSHIVNTLRVIWNHSRITTIEPIRLYRFNHTIYCHEYILKITAFLLGELLRRKALCMEDTNSQRANNVLDADWNCRSLISPRGLLGNIKR